MDDISWIVPQPSLNEDPRRNFVLSEGDAWVLEWDTSTNATFSISLVQWWPQTEVGEEFEWEIISNYTDLSYGWEVSLDMIDEKYMLETTVTLYFDLIAISDEDGESYSSFSHNFNVTIPQKQDKPSWTPIEADENETGTAVYVKVPSSSIPGIAAGATITGLATFPLILGLVYLLWMRLGRRNAAAATATGSHHQSQSQMQHLLTTPTPSPPAAESKQQDPPKLPLPHLDYQKPSSP